MSTDVFTPSKRGRRLLPVILQAEATECGLACLAMIANFFGNETTLLTLRQEFSLSLKGVTLARVVAMAERLGLRSRALRVELEHLGRIALPAILHWNFNHFVVLKSVKKNLIVVHDPAVGERRVSFAEASTSFTGVALELAPTEEFKEVKSEKRIPISRLVGTIHGLRRSLLQVFGLAIALETFVLVGPLFIQCVTDQVLANHDGSLLASLGVAFSLFVVLQSAIIGARGLAAINLGASLNWSWTNNVFDHLIRLPEAFFQKRFIGDIVSRFNAISVIQQTLSSRFVEAILDGLMAIFTLVLLLVYSPLLCAITLLAFAFYCVIRIGSFRFLREANIQQIAAAARQQSLFLTSIQGARAIRLFNRVPMQSARFSNQTAKVLDASVHVQRWTLLFIALNRMVFGLQAVATVWLGAAIVLDGNLSIGMLVAFLAYSSQFSVRAGSFIDYATELGMLRLQADRLADLVLAETEGEDTSRGTIDDPEPSIRLNNISYRYGDAEPWILQDLDLEVRAGESVAIVGDSGCGKTTLIKILLGLLDPQQGSVSIGNIDLNHLGKRRYRDMLGTVLEDDVLLAGSIAENISFFDLDATPETIEAAARRAAIHDEIVAMPMAYHSLVGDMGSTLSAGQRQRILFARALYKNPRILVLDEATSRLDVGNERRLNEAVKRMNITRISIAHRPETIASADRVVEISGGQAKVTRALRNALA